MKYLLLLFLLTSCSALKTRGHQKSKEIRCEKESSFLNQMEKCMTTFSKQGFDSMAIIDICESVYRRRK